MVNVDFFFALHRFLKSIEWSAIRAAGSLARGMCPSCGALQWDGHKKGRDLKEEGCALKELMGEVSAEQSRRLS